MKKATELRPVITYARDAIVERVHIAAALNVGEETVEAMNLPRFAAGKRDRYLWGQVLDELAFRADPEYEQKRRMLEKSRKAG